MDEQKVRMDFTGVILNNSQIYEIDEDFYFSIYKKLTNVKEVNFDD